MLSQTALHLYLERSAFLRPDHTAIEEPGGEMITYGSLADLSDRLRDRLRHLGVGPGDRVGLYMRKSIDAVVSIFGILKTGAAYVPVDPDAPASRNAYILNDCSVKAVVMEERFADGFCAEISRLGQALPPGPSPKNRGGEQAPPLLLIDGTGGGLPLKAMLEREEKSDCGLRIADCGILNPQSAIRNPQSDDLAYILYTSGSTGKPKGVMLSHRNATSYVDWCSEVFQPTEEDRFSSHAPFHFDLSILDIYVPIKHGATLILIGEEIGKDPARLAPLIAEKRVSIWYSAPSILSLLAQFGKVERYDYSALRTVLFAGEVFPIKHLRALKALWPAPRYFNLYGPTETNVCTFYEVPATIPEDRAQPFPIGKVCSHFRARVVDETGKDVLRGQEGELCVSGAGMMQGYWNLPDRTGSAFLVDQNGERWYKTGDIVVEDAAGDYVFIGRRDRMVKKRGYRVELGEIEACLYRHPAISDAAVIALQDEESGVRIKAFIACKEGAFPSIIDMKRFCAENLPLYMVPDLFSFHQELPKTSTAKIDYQRLRVMSDE